MEQRVLELLGASQLADAPSRTAAEAQLKGLYTSDHYPRALVTIGAHQEIPVPDRLAAIIQLRQFVQVGWSASLDDFAGQVLVSPQTKALIRDSLLGIILNGNTDSKVISSTAAVVAKVAKSDFPEEWPNLLDQLLAYASHGSDGQIQGILIVLGELVEDALDEDEFYHYAGSVLEFLHSIATDGNRKLMMRALAVKIFRACFDFVENLKDRNEAGIAAFAKGILDVWNSFFASVIKESLPTMPIFTQSTPGYNIEDLTTWRGVVALKIQVIEVCIRQTSLRCIHSFFLSRLS